MLSVNQLNLQNHKITELSQVVLHLIQDRRMCDMDTTCDIFMLFVDEVNNHLKLEDTQLYGTLLLQKDPQIKTVANQFMSGSVEIKKIFQRYIRRWCDNKKLRVNDHASFVEDTEAMMNVVLSRVQDETEKLYPLVRKVTENMAA